MLGRAQPSPAPPSRLGSPAPAKLGDFGRGGFFARGTKRSVLEYGAFRTAAKKKKRSHFQDRGGGQSRCQQEGEQPTQYERTWNRLETPIIRSRGRRPFVAEARQRFFLVELLASHAKNRPEGACSEPHRDDGTGPSRQEAGARWPCGAPVRRRTPRIRRIEHEARRQNNPKLELLPVGGTDKGAELPTEKFRGGVFFVFERQPCIGMPRAEMRGSGRWRGALRTGRPLRWAGNCGRRANGYQRPPKLQPAQPRRAHGSAASPPATKTHDWVLLR